MTASEVLQDYLDRVSAAFMLNNLAAYVDSIALPCNVIMSDRSNMVVDEDELRQNFETFRDTLRLHRVTDFIRLVEGAAFLDENLLSGSYVTHVLSGGLRLLDPFHSQIVLRREGALWRAVSMTNSIANSRWARLMPASMSLQLQEGTKT